MVQTAIMGVLRHILTIGAGALVTSGYLDGSQAEVLIGSGMALAGIAWSLLEKRYRT